MSKQAHAFRGEFISVCARVEQWCVTVLDAAKGREIASGKPYLFGQKLGAIKKLAEQEQSLFRHPQAVSKLMDEFAPYGALRAKLGHAVLRGCDESNSGLFAFQLPTNAALPDDNGRFWIAASEADDLIAKLKGLAKRIEDQGVKSS
jgi:hypothetical protein